MEIEKNIKIDKNNLRDQYDKLLPITVDITLAHNIQRGEGFIGELIAFAKNQFGKYANRNTEMSDIVFNGKSVRDVSGHIRGDGSLKIALLRYVPKLIESGIYLETTPRGQGINSHIFAAKIAVGSALRAVGFAIIEDTNNNNRRYYDHNSIEEFELDNKNKAPGTQSGGNARNTTPSTKSTKREPIINILQNHLTVNSFKLFFYFLILCSTVFTVFHQS